MQTTRLSRATPEVGGAGAPIRVKQSERNDDSNSERWYQDICARSPRPKQVGTASCHEPCACGHGTSGFAEKYRPPSKPAEVSSHSRRLLQRTLQIQWLWTASANKARRAARKARQKCNSKSGKEGGKGQNQSQNPCTNMKVVCWCCGKKGHFSTQCWGTHPRKPVQFRRKPTRSMQRKTEVRHGLGSGLFGTRITSCSCGAAAAAGSRELSGFGIV